MKIGRHFYFMDLEYYKAIPDTKGFYEVSNMGNVRSLRFGKVKQLKPGKAKNCYLFVFVIVDGKRKLCYIHQLVAIVFLGHVPCGHKMVVDHINDIRTDNRLENLQVITKRENCFKTQGKYSSKYKGVHWFSRDKKWVSMITINKKRVYLGAFENEYPAHLAYQSKLKELGL